MKNKHLIFTIFSLIAVITMTTASAQQFNLSTPQQQAQQRQKQQLQQQQARTKQRADQMRAYHQCVQNKDTRYQHCKVQCDENYTAKANQLNIKIHDLTQLQDFADVRKSQQALFNLTSQKIKCQHNCYLQFSNTDGSWCVMPQ
jgi:uncharacterized protein YpmS